MKECMKKLLCLILISSSLIAMNDIRQYHPNVHQLFVMNLIKENGVDQEIVLKKLNNSLTDILYFQGKPIGFVTYHNGFSCFECCFKKNNPGQISTIIIDSNHRRRGFGNILLNHVLQELQFPNCESITTRIPDDNQCARKFFLRNGFKKNGSNQYEFKWRK